MVVARSTVRSPDHLIGVVDVPCIAPISTGKCAQVLQLARAIPEKSAPLPAAVGGITANMARIINSTRVAVSTSQRPEIGHTADRVVNERVIVPVRNHGISYDLSGIVDVIRFAVTVSVANGKRPAADALVV